MEVTLIRQRGGRYAMRTPYARAVESPGKGWLPHDAVHYVVEKQLGLDDAFWGHLSDLSNLHMYPTSDTKILAYLFYEDLGRAIPWLCDVFGFEERFRLEAPSGLIAHAEVHMDGAAVMLGNVGPRNSARPATVRSGVYVFVDDVDALAKRASEGGAEIVQAPADQPFGDRICVVLDPEGHEWYFAQHLRDVSIDEVRAMLGGQR